MRISAPLTQPTLPTNQKTIPIPTPLLSPTDGMDETDTFDPLKAIPFTKGKPRKRQSTSDSIRSILDALIMIATNTPIDDTLEQEVNLEESYPLSKDEVSVGCVRKSMEIQALVPGTSICQEPESYLDEMPSPSPKETRRSSADGDAYPQSKATRTQVTPGPEVKRKISVPRSSSASSDSSTSSDSLVSSSSTPSKSSPVSADATVASAPGKSFGASRSLLKSGGIKIPSSLLTLLPSSAAKGKPSQIVRSITPPSTPPLDQTEGMLNDTAAEDPQDQQQQEQSSIKRMTQATDPRALTLKRMAYLHTLKKLRERERRPFRHAVLLHLMILQLRRGITDYHCGEIADFYTAMWAAQFPARWDIASAIALAQQRPNNLQQTPHQTLQDYQQQPGAPQSSMARPKRPLSTPVQSRLQTSITQSPSGGNSSNSADDSDASMTSGILSPSPQRTMQAAPFRDESSTTSIPPELIAELERKSSFASFTTRRSPPPASSESDSDHDQDDESEEDSDKEDYPAHDEKGKEKEIVCSSPQPTAIVPKRTTGRKGLIYHQQQQLQVQVQQHLQGGNAPSDHQVTEGRTHKALEHASTWMQAQLLGTRPRFATSTLTTVATNGSELSTRPLVAVPVMMAPQALTKSQSNVPHWGFQPQMTHSHCARTLGQNQQGLQDGSTSKSKQWSSKSGDDPAACSTPIPAHALLGCTEI
ncbi:hypothetical protein BGX31_011292 [Mortierella sp. GBA43]|nr:hypothetical protein BGX31_011292 [Mortierella sp. GBA43]